VKEHARRKRLLLTQSTVPSLEMLMIIDLKRCILAYILVSTFVGAGAHDSFSQHHAVLHSVSAPAFFRQTPAPASPTASLYEREMNAVGLVHVRTVETLPLQHIVIFEKRN
jgi:hypothetical protein